MRLIDGMADGSLAPALAVNMAACFSAAASASDPVAPLEPTASKRAYKTKTSANEMKRSMRQIKGYLVFRRII
jgi:hypothetical protein